jgi:hypothetical protein
MNRFLQLPLRFALLVLALLLLCAIAAPPALAQCSTTLTGTFKTPSGLTPAAAGLDAGETIAAIATYGKLEFVAYDSFGKRATRIICGAVSYIPQPVVAWIKSDGTIINAAGANSVTLVPTAGVTPTGLVYLLKVTLNGSSANFLIETTWTEQKALPSGAQDWGALAPAGIAALTYSGYNTVQNAGTSLALRTIVNFTGTGVSCADNSGSARTDCTITAGGGGGAPGGLPTQVQYNNAGAFGGIANLTANGTNPLLTAIVAPASPSAGFLAFFEDSTDLRFHDKNAAGTIGTTVVADAGAANNFLTAISPAGVISKAQPSFANLSGSIALGQTPLTTRGDILTANVTPALIRLALGGSGTYLRSNGTDALWSALLAGDIPSLSYLPLSNSAQVSVSTSVAAGGGFTGAPFIFTNSAVYSSNDTIFEVRDNNV